MFAQVMLVGSEFEENLSIRYLASALAPTGLDTEILAFDDSSQKEGLIDAVIHSSPLVVGISVPFQARAEELLSFATSLRQRGYSGHVCVGGHFATFQYMEILSCVPAIDSIVRHEGEETFRELCEALRDERETTSIPGLVYRRAGDVIVGPTRPLPKLDSLSFPKRDGRPHDVVGVPCSPLVGSRGCYADCSFCCIFAYSENAQGPRYRMRTPKNIVEEMKLEYEQRGVRLFIFHDDNFFLPYAPKNLERYRELAELIRAEEMENIGLVIKCRPNDVQPEVFRLLKSMGMIRAYVGIETNSEEGVISLNRRITSEDNRRALRILKSLEVYYSFNVLIFDPEATLAGVATNLDFMSEFADTPFNFCRAEVYAGTPLREILEADGRLMGDYLAWNYEIRSPRVELLFRIAVKSFYGRNFKSDGIANLNMGVRFDNEVMRHFYPAAWDRSWDDRLVDFSRRVGENSVRHMREALHFVTEVGLEDYRSVNAFALNLARKVADADLELLKEVKGHRREMEERIAKCGGPTTRDRFGRGMPAWAAETGRLGTSVGREFSSEQLPAPEVRGGAS